jgi:hypothetical protein
MRRSRLYLGAALLLLGGAARGDQLSVLDRGAWRTWWQSGRAPARWPAAQSTLGRAVSWQSVRPGVELAELRVAARATLRFRLILLRVDSRRFDWHLVEQRDESAKPAWEIDSAPPVAAFAFNAGQFANGRAWGWVVRDGKQVQPPAVGPLSMAFVVDRAGSAKLIPPDEIEKHRDDAVLAFQSYPTLLAGDGIVPRALRKDDSGVDLHHRDSRLALGILRDGRVLLVLTRFDLGGGLLRPLPIGPNTPEMAAIMGALGCERAVMLDGGISSQLLVRAQSGPPRMWSAYRWVPLGLVATSRP